MYCGFRLDLLQFATRGLPFLFRISIRTGVVSYHNPEIIKQPKEADSTIRLRRTDDKRYVFTLLYRAEIQRNSVTIYVPTVNAGPRP